jgi:hypothetical protein
LAWEISASGMPAAGRETRYSIAIRGVLVGGATRNFSYTVTTFPNF